MGARWEEVLDHQLDLWRFWRSPLGVEYAKGYTADVVTKHPDEADVYTDLANRMARMLWHNEPVYVDPDMMTLFEAAVATWKPEPLVQTDLICESGFLWLPRPITFTDIHEMKVTFRAISWHPSTFFDRVTRKPAAQGVMIALYHYRTDVDDYTDKRFEARADLWLTHLTTWQYGQNFSTMKGGDLFSAEEMAFYGEGSGDRALDQHVKLTTGLQCLWRLMAQTISVVGKRRASSPFRGRIARAKFPERHVTVIELRRPHHAPDSTHEPRDVDWTHRWIVDGHWRWQWYRNAKEGACGHIYRDATGAVRYCQKMGGVHRQIWISPFVKGPEDKPLDVRKLRVFEWVR